jgi:hypothetical protein
VCRRMGFAPVTLQALAMLMRVMKLATTKPTQTQAEQLASAMSWKNKLVKDAYEQKLGVVVSVRARGEEIVLTAKFQGETESREFTLGAGDGIERLMPGDTKARYRPLTEEDRHALAANRAAS